MWGSEKIDIPENELAEKRTLGRGSLRLGGTGRGNGMVIEDQKRSGGGEVLLTG